MCRWWLSVSESATLMESVNLMLVIIVNMESRYVGVNMGVFKIGLAIDVGGMANTVLL